MISVCCKKHKRYTAKRAPTGDCQQCWFIFRLRRGLLNTASAVLLKSDVYNTQSECVELVPYYDES